MTVKNKNGGNKNRFNETGKCVCSRMMIHAKFSNRNIICDILDKKTQTHNSTH